MKTFDLTRVKVENLDESEVLLLKEYLKTLSKKEVKNFMLRILDTQYSLAGENGIDKDKKVERFLSDKIFLPHLLKFLKKEIAEDSHLEPTNF
jgi:hypothetical protein